jgi:hypothetical protein
MAKVKCGTINPNTLKIPGKPNRVTTPEVKNSCVWADRKKDYLRHKEKQKLRRYSDEYGNGGVFLSGKTVNIFSLLLFSDQFAFAE